MTYTEKDKEYIYRWRQNNLDKYRAVVKKGQKKYIENNREKNCMNVLIMYHYKKDCNYEVETKKFRKIML